MNRFSAIVAALITLTTLLSGCLRYVPSRSELNEQQSLPSNIEVLPAEEFWNYEDDMQQRLDALLSERKDFMSLGAGYRIGSGDFLSTKVFGFSDLSVDSEVGQDGTMEFPLLGQVKVVGKTVSQLRSYLSSRYRKYVREPQVEVSVKDYLAKRVYVVGEVANPGAYPLKRGNQLVSELLSEAGGRTDKASNTILLMPSNDKPSADVSRKFASKGIEIDFEELYGNANNPPLLIPLIPGDTIIVPEVGMFQVDGEVEKPGSYKLASRTSVMGAIAAAGGLNYSANANEVEVIRDIGKGKKVSLALDLEQVALGQGSDVRLRDGDIIRVPSESGRFVKRQIIEVLNGLFRGIGVSGRVN